MFTETSESQYQKAPVLQKVVENIPFYPKPLFQKHYLKTNQCNEIIAAYLQILKVKFWSDLYCIPSNKFHCPSILRLVRYSSYLLILKSF